MTRTAADAPGGLIIVGGLVAAIATGLLAAVVPATEPALATVWWWLFVLAGGWCVGWVVWQVVAEVLLDREIEQGNAETLRRLAAGRPADEMAPR